MKKRILAALAATALLTGLVALPASAEEQEVVQPATQPKFICEPLDSGKIDNDQPGDTVEVFAPAGFLISGYCVKAGTEKFFIEVNPPAAVVFVNHPVKDSVSHYSLQYVPIPDPEPTETPTPTPTPTEPPDSEPTPTPTPTTPTPEDTPEPELGKTGPAETAGLLALALSLAGLGAGVLAMRRFLLKTGH